MAEYFNQIKTKRVTHKVVLEDETKLALGHYSRIFKFISGASGSIFSNFVVLAFRVDLVEFSELISLGLVIGFLLSLLMVGIIVGLGVSLLTTYSTSYRRSFLFGAIAGYIIISLSSVFSTSSEFFAMTG